MSNLLQKASIITTPTAYDTGKILSVKPVQYYGPELVTNGDFATDSDWTKGTGVVITGGKANWINTINNVGVTQSGIITSGSNYKVVFTVSNYVSGSVRLRFPSITERLTSNGTYTYYINATDTNLYIQGETNTDPNVNLSIDNVSVKEVFNADFDFTRNSSATRVGSNGLIQDVASNLPRIDYTGGVGSWKFEPQRTNRVSNSNQFSGSETNVSVSRNQLISPDGTLNADRVLDNSNSGEHLITGSYTGGITSGLDYTASAFFKSDGTGGQGIIRFYVGAWNNAVFNLEDGTISYTSSGVSKIENYGNGWYRCSLKATAVSDYANTIIQLAIGNSLNQFSYQGASNLGVYFWGVQFESGSYPTSYIVSNSGSATTRLADVANNAGSSDLISSTEGVLYAEISALADDGTFRVIGINGVATNVNENRIQIYFRNTANIINFGMESGNSSQFFSQFPLDVKLNNKLALKYNASSCSFWINGFQVGEELNKVMPTGLSRLEFNIQDGSDNFYGNTKCVAVFKEALTDLELECLVSWMSFSDLGINFGYTVE